MLPVAGMVVGFLFWVDDVEAKGLVGGTANTIIDGIPIVGLGKGLAELLGGVDVIPDLDEWDLIEFRDPFGRDLDDLDLTPLPVKAPSAGGRSPFSCLNPSWGGSPLPSLRDLAEDIRWGNKNR